MVPNQNQIKRLNVTQSLWYMLWLLFILSLQAELTNCDDQAALQQTTEAVGKSVTKQVAGIPEFNATSSLLSRANDILKYTIAPNVSRLVHKGGVMESIKNVILDYIASRPSSTVASVKVAHSARGKTRKPKSKRRPFKKSASVTDSHEKSAYNRSASLYASVARPSGIKRESAISIGSAHIGEKSSDEYASTSVKPIVVPASNRSSDESADKPSSDESAIKIVGKVKVNAKEDKEAAGDNLKSSDKSVVKSADVETSEKKGDSVKSANKDKLAGNRSKTTLAESPPNNSSSKIIFTVDTDSADESAGSKTAGTEAASAGSKPTESSHAVPTNATSAVATSGNITTEVNSTGVLNAESAPVTAKTKKAKTKAQRDHTTTEASPASSKQPSRPSAAGSVSPTDHVKYPGRVDSRDESNGDSSDESKGDPRDESKVDSRGESKGDSGSESNVDGRDNSKSDPDPESKSRPRGGALVDSKSDNRGRIKSASRDDGKSDSESKDEAKDSGVLDDASTTIAAASTAATSSAPAVSSSATAVKLKPTVPLKQSGKAEGVGVEERGDAPGDVDESEEVGAPGKHALQPRPPPPPPPPPPPRPRRPPQVRQHPRDVFPLSSDIDSDSGGGSGYMLAYFVLFVLVVGLLYVVCHRKQKIIACLIEGRRLPGTARRSSSRHVSGSGGGSGSSGFKRLPIHDDELPKVPHEKPQSVQNFVF